MIRLLSQRAAFRFLAISIGFVVALLVVARFHTTAAPNSAGAPGASSAAVAPPSGVFYTVTGTADNTDAVIHGGTGTAGNPFQMSSLRGAILNGNTVITSVAGPVTISVPAGTYLLSVNNPNTPTITGTIDFPDLEIGSTFNQNTTIIGTGGVPKIQQTVADNDVITTGFLDAFFTPVAVTLRLENLEVTGGGFSGIFTGVDNSSGRSNTTIVNCNIHGNSNPFGQGGGIFNQTGDLTLQNCTFANNSASLQGGAIFFDLPNSNGSPGTFGSLIITDSTFNNNTASVTNNVAGGAIAIFAPNRVENTYSITGSTFTSNHASGTGGKGGAIGSGGPGTLTVNLSRFVGNTAVGGGTGVAGQGTAPVNAINNWWGCDALPGSSGCDTINGSGVTSNPRLDLVLTSVPGCNSTTLTADFSKNSANQSVAPTVLNGLTVLFAVVAGPAGSNVSPPSATISGFMASSNLTATAGGTATVSATLDNGTQTASAEIDKAVAVTTNPTNQAVCEGGTATFTAAASGNPTPTVQWQVSTNGGGLFTDIPGATNPILSFTATAAQNGNQYRAVFTNMCESTTNTATTTAATLTVNTAPSVSTNPTSQTACEGATASFTAAANGSPAPTVQWQVSTNGGGTFSNIPGATSTTLAFTAATAQSGNQYRAVFTNSCGTATTTGATLTVQPNTTTSDPADQTVCQGTNANFSTTAGGTGPFHYAWTVDGSASGGDSSSISVATGSLSVGNHTVAVTTTGTCGSASQSATLTVQENTATSDPPDQTVCQGATANFSTTASGTGPFHYAWTVDGSASGGDSSSISVATGSLSVSNHTVAVTTTGACGSASQSATLTVQANTTTSDPPDQTVCQGTNANFSTTAGGTGPFHYAWTVDGSASGGDSSSISVATGSLSVGNHTVAVTTTGTCGSASQSATLTVQQNTTTTDPPDQTACLGGTASFSTNASGTGPFSFVWKKGVTVLNNGDFGGRVSIVTGSSTSTLTISNIQASDFGTYNIETTGSCNTATQSSTLTVNSTPPTITLNGQNIELWPPNHSYHTITVTNLVASASSCDGTVTINSVIIDHVTSDEVENGNGDGNTSNDIIIACNRKSVQLRSERDGSGDGRVYTIYFKATDGLGHSTTVTAKVTVPKSQNGDASVDSGPHYTVTNATCP
jgi:predicted outer membrane repeat protein